jgi:hypothetical protein
MTRQAGVAMVAVVIVGALAAPVRGDGGPGRNLRAELSAEREVPIVASAATGRFRAVIADDGASFDYRLDYENFEGVVTQSHIHIAQKFASGGISVWLCQTATNPAPLAVQAITPTCGAPGGDGAEASGTISAQNVLGPAGQAIPASDFDDLLAMIRSGNAYVNVHSGSAPGGEVRGQIESVRGHEDR